MLLLSLPVKVGTVIHLCVFWVTVLLRCPNFESSLLAAFLWNKNLAHPLHWIMQLLFYSWTALRNTASQEKHWEVEKWQICSLSVSSPVLMDCPNILSHTTVFGTLLDGKQEPVHNNSIVRTFVSSHWVQPSLRYSLVCLNRFFTNSRLPEGCHREKWKQGRKDGTV